MITQEQLDELTIFKHNRPIDQDEIDVRVQGLVDNTKPRYLNQPPLYSVKVLDVGSLDGLHACQLARFGALVTCSDIRPLNLIKSLCRALYSDVKNLAYRLLDMETMHEQVCVDEFDVIFHSGCFYHLADPVEHLFNIRGLAKRILLETHISNPDRYSSGTIRRGDNLYLGTWYPEGGFKDTQAAKDTRNSFWLSEESLEKLFYDCNLEIEAVIYKGLDNPHGKRNCYLLKRG